MSYINLEDVNGNGILTVSEAKSATGESESLVCFYTEYKRTTKSKNIEIVYLFEKSQIPDLIKFLQSQVEQPENS